MFYLPGFDAHVIAAGRVRLERQGAVVGVRGRGAVNGATALLVPGEERQHTVTTIEDTLILNITREEMERVSKQIPEIRIGIIRHLMDLMFESFQMLNEPNCAVPTL